MMGHNMVTTLNISKGGTSNVKPRTEREKADHKKTIVKSEPEKLNRKQRRARSKFLREANK